MQLQLRADLRFESILCETAYIDIRKVSDTTSAAALFWSSTDYFCCTSIYFVLDWVQRYLRKTWYEYEYDTYEVRFPGTVDKTYR